MTESLVEFRRGPKLLTGRRWYFLRVGTLSVSFGRWFVAWRD